MAQFGTVGSMERDPDRVARITVALASEELDALICALPSNVLLLTGYWPVIGNTIAIATRDGAIGLIAPEDELRFARGSWADCIESFRPASLECILTPLEAVNGSFRAVAQKVWLSGKVRIGFEGAGSFDPSSYASSFIYGAAIEPLLTTVFPDATTVDATLVVNRLRSTLTDREIGCVRRACGIAHNAYATVASKLERGMTELDVAALLRGALLGPARSDGFAYCMSGPNSAQAYAAYQYSTERRIENGDFVLVHCNSQSGGFWTDITRTFAIGDIDDQQRSALEAIFEATKAAFSVLRPGARAAGVDAAARDVLAEYGFLEEFRHATGHGVGLAAINHNAPPRIHPASTEILMAGMVFNIEPAVYVEHKWGNRLCNLAVVTKDGMECLTPFLNTIG